MKSDQLAGMRHIIIFVILSICFFFISKDALDRGFQRVLDETIDSGYANYFYLILVVLFGTTFLKVSYRKPGWIQFSLFIFSIFFMLSFNSGTGGLLRQFMFSLFVLLWVFCFMLGRDFAYWDSLKFNNLLQKFSVFVIFP